jgi:hypothetical protein
MIRYQTEGAHDGGEAEVARASVEELFPHPMNLRPRPFAGSVRLWTLNMVRYLESACKTDQLKGLRF